MGEPMADLSLCFDSQTLYAVRVLVAPELDDAGITHLESGAPARLDWNDVLAALAAEVGEPEGVRTIVFDLVCRSGDGYRVYRMDAEPGEEATHLARGLETRLPEAASASIKSIAVDGIPSRWYPDLSGFEAEALVELEEIDKASV